MAYKVSIIGAGAVGATLAQRVLESGIADVVLLDIAKGIARGKSLDLMDASPIVGHENKITGTEDYAAIENSDVVIVTAGLPRRPGMAREELISKNASIVKDVSINIKKFAPSSIVIVVTNPLDSMTYLTRKVTGFKNNKVFGMAGVLDSSRFIAIIAEELNIPRSAVETYVLGSHGDTMVPALSKTFVSGKPLDKVINKEKITELVKRTRDRGAEIVSLLGTGSAFYSPSAAAFKMVRAVLENTRETMTVSAYLDGQYALKDIYIGVPAVIGKNGVESIVELDLSGDEKAAFRRSADTIKKSIEVL